MNEPTPAPVLPPVPWWERVAAGVLLAWLVAWAIHWDLTPREWMLWLARTVGTLHQSALNWVAAPVVNPARIIHSNAPLDVMSSSLMLLEVLALPVLVGWSLAVTSGRLSVRWRTGLWWLVFAHGVAGLVEASVAARSNSIFMFAASPEAASLAWYKGWFRHLQAPIDRAYLFDLVPYPVEILFAVLVLWFSRKRRQKPTVADSTAQA